MIASVMMRTQTASIPTSTANPTAPQAAHRRSSISRMRLRSFSPSTARGLASNRRATRRPARVGEGAAMTTCECCGVREAYRVLGGDSLASVGLQGAPHCGRCVGAYGFDGVRERIRAGRSTQTSPQSTGRCSADFGIDKPCELGPGHSGPHHHGDLRWLGTAAPAAIRPTTAEIEFIAPTVVTCRDCKSPATMGAECVYCHLRIHGAEKNQRRMVDESEGAKVARARMDLHDRRMRPRVTNDTRELAKGHPWECDE